MENSRKGGYCRKRQKRQRKKVEDTLVSSHMLEVLRDSGIQIVCDIPYQCY